eukprot:CAMPEP_0170767462 /NCGR_PEP_ID=MMETSP0733-20121128/5768_1 /TAXON_ID=186038 /ORGANISM="Fragilariopsis kerguelensis, Strain L26-C5" /LENGTH=216 /DNA_ID=CAMNT_0011108615 /DNA_START=137 /DNA_END=787 /DNA_ORIENTATION=+
MDLAALNLQYNLPAWWQGPDYCPAFDDVVDATAMKDFSYDTYQGTWYAFAHDEPTQPAFCNCDTYEWSLLKNHTTTEVNGYNSQLTVDCNPSSMLPRYQYTMKLQGMIDGHDQPGLHVEGAPSLGADYIPQFILWVEKEKSPTTGEETYTRSIVYSCKKNYLGMKVFHSAQFFSREPHLSLEEKTTIIDRARLMGLVFNSIEHIKITDFETPYCHL